MSAPGRPADGEMATMRWPALGTTVVVRAPRQDLPAVRRAVSQTVDRVDMLASRFRVDSELSRINARAGEWAAISPDLLDLVELGIWGAEVSDGAVDPTLALELAQLGYDVDFADLPAVDRTRPLTIRPGPATVERGQPWRRVEFRDDPAMIRLPSGVGLDLGATAKGRAADLATVAARRAVGEPVLVSLGGDVSAVGPPPAAGWAIGIADDHRTSPAACEEAVTIWSGGLATSSLLARRWWHDGQPVHHVLDPRTGCPVTPHWRTATAVARTCAEANVAATAALVLGQDAPEWLGHHGFPARLVATDGTIVRVAGWPA